MPCDTISPSRKPTERIELPSDDYKSTVIAIILCGRKRSGTGLEPATSGFPGVLSSELPRPHISYSLRHSLSISFLVRLLLGRLSNDVSARSSRCPVGNSHGFLVLILIICLRGRISSLLWRVIIPLTVFVLIKNLVYIRIISH